MNDRELLIERLNAGRDELLAAVEGLTDEQSAKRPVEGAWSPLECVEHVATVETLFLRRLQTQSVDVPEEMSREREPVLYARIATRDRKINGPEIAQPKGRFSTVGEAVEAFQQARAHTLKWLDECPYDLRRRAAEHPALGPGSVYEMVLILAAHAARHAAQIRECRAL
jgi:hypothetical protein